MTGSSPRVRGKLGLEAVMFFEPVAHPRACGENLEKPIILNCRGGSSPRVRGKPRCRRRDRSIRGLIPARAGKTARVIVSVMGFGAHPRACGEN